MGLKLGGCAWNGAPPSCAPPGALALGGPTLWPSPKVGILRVRRADGTVLGPSWRQICGLEFPDDWTLYPP